MESSAYYGRARVYVLGEVARPASYPLAPDERVEDAIRQAGGIRASGSQRRIEIRRGNRKQPVDLLRFRTEGQMAQNPSLRHGDVVFVPTRGPQVRLVGAIGRPGTLELLATENTLTRVIALAGGPTVALKPDTAIQVMRFADGQRSVQSYTATREVLARTKIQDGDTIYVPPHAESAQWDLRTLPSLLESEPLSAEESHVFVRGAVQQPGPYPFEAQRTVNHYLELAGGLTPDAKAHLRLIDRRGKKRRFAQGETVFVSAGDAIEVPQRQFSTKDVLYMVLSVVGIAATTSVTVLTLTK